MRFVFDGPPGHVSGRFVEVEDDAGTSVASIGTSEGLVLGGWKQEGDLWILSIHAAPSTERAALRAALVEAQRALENLTHAGCPGDCNEWSVAPRRYAKSRAQAAVAVLARYPERP
jgi:hypothetical protein